MAQQISYQIDNNLYLSITDRCTLECAFCPKTLGDMTVKGYDLTINHRPTAEEVIASIDDPTQYEEVVFCGYGEPTLRLNVLLEVARHIKLQGGQVRVNTDGLCNLVHKHNTLPELGECVDSLSISLNAQNQEIYDLHCRPNLPGSYEAMLDFIREAPSYIADVTVSAVDGLEGVDIPACEAITKAMKVKFRRRTLNQVG
ncbi:MAG: TatD family nuclease-associated radical SAM protein [Candidatus Thiodiazotropha sp. (ex Lucinoma aequizonata)]|nr:TatD family nuclease-associated radical SAM protein [Candidatus Thiodiazotropha sp. (ex Lucinoma aequizonata)]MCU7887657.1 TatD family nuclease-associated radical SAM protein [Candidatus Thiodiazotropha sp. (ex Lucinoma aequizonata)]MCU7896477.1 TatD family nuclease-associated radical SAM protein [Candidatus Thiodiazotropha sp. (ex Lucinoma aequizonata)]MCU7898202.1 TatD family nuclease-associated radical SAM protein [Candidatus Thiodiazotropha sp. (ex Lucinoma aequizonata)]MCU7903833.1 TatD